MKVLLTTLNSKYIHTNLALRYLYEVGKAHASIHTKEFTINENLEDILAHIASEDWDLIGFSCYIWNIEQTLRLCQTLKMLFPSTKILLGGPEVSFDAALLMQEHAFIDFILSGEGEMSFCKFILSLQNPDSLHEVPGLTYRCPINLSKASTEASVHEEEAFAENQRPKARQRVSIVENKKPPPLSALGLLPEIYFKGSTENWENRIVYYESSRGCVFRCAYCLSSIEKGLRFFPQERVKKELMYLVQQNVRQIKFVDRTFNAKESITLEMIQFLKLIDNGSVNFHFEVMAHLLTDPILKALQDVRPGLFQFEIGVQSTYGPTLHAVGREEQFPVIQEKIQILKSFHNIHLHLDLIAGLPHESKARFIQSFNEVFDLQPHALQLGFLKMLKGTPLRQRAKELNLRYRPYPPYEILSTPWISFCELLELKSVEKALDRFYNTQRHKRSLAYLYHRFYATQGYHFFEQLANIMPTGTFSKDFEYKSLWDFACQIPGVNANLLAELMAVDYSMTGRFSTLPFGCLPHKAVPKEDLWKIMESQAIRDALEFESNTSVKEAMKHIGALMLTYNINGHDLLAIESENPCFLLIHYHGTKKWNGDYPHVYVTRRDYGILTQ